ncbi:PREDICTED: serine/threonine-protein kinase LMTK1, partial [Condylura cristata]|uniref:serine/threonine-protein kinase LMTK1 n=1 Tax=Condylura cristata TaxID=143302 RepID=UPI0006431844
AFCPPFCEDPLSTPPSGASPGGEDLGEAEARRTAQHPCWTSNVSANNSTGRTAGPELGHPLAPEDPGEPLLGLQVASPCTQPGCGLAQHPQCPSAEGFMPAAGLVTAPAAGGESPGAEPRLAEEAGSAPGGQLPLPSTPPPSQEGAPLPAERASTPTTLPAPPAGGSLTAVPEERACAPDSGSSRPEGAAPGRALGGIREATPSTLADLSSASPWAEELDVTPAVCSPQRQVGAPDLLGSLHTRAAAGEGLSPSAAGAPRGQPRASDSGYDTENYESPEFVLKEAPEPREPEAFGAASLAESQGPETRLPAPPGGVR